MSMQLLKTHCPMDCPDTCALEVSVEEGRIAAIRGAKDAAVTRGFLCDKVTRFDRRVYHEERVLFPLRRAGRKGQGGFERITWQEAAAEIASRFREIAARWGGEAILPYHYGGSNGFLSDGLLDDLFFARLGASRLRRTLCAVPAGEVAMGMYGKMPGVAFEDYPRAKFILIWGANPKASNIHLVPFLKQARRAGAKLAVVDPLRNFSAEEADLHLPVYPGTDVAVALAMIRVWRERGQIAGEFLARHATGAETLLAAADAWPLERAAATSRVPAADIERLARLYAESSPAVLRAGWGFERNLNGVQSMAAVLALPAVLGKFGAPGSGYTLSNGAASKFDAARVLGEFTWKTRELNMTQLGALLEDGLDPPVKALVVYNANPAASTPDQNAVLRGLRREDLFTVVHEQVMTDTARYADILLPATTFLEHYDVRRGYGNYAIGGVRPVIAPRGEAKSNDEMFALLGQAMGFADEVFRLGSRELMERAAGALRIPGCEADAATLLAGGALSYDFPGPRPVQFLSVFPRTPDGKIHLAPRVLGAEPYAYREVKDERHPLALVSPSTSKMISSTMGEYNFSELKVSIHPEDAAERGIGEGDRVRVFNALGEVICPARVTPRMRPGVVAMAKGAWRRASLNGSTSTALCPGHVHAEVGGACFNDARVEIARA
jgi:anaerobic selenocysteine-containing dehydrogenase